MQLVIPIGLTEHWNVISRTILPVIHQSEVVGDDSQTGLGDTVQSFFLSPKAPGWGGLIWGVGPAFLIPTATEEVLGSGKFGLGPTAVLLKQEGPWTYGILANHIWSVERHHEADAPVSVRRRALRLVTCTGSPRSSPPTTTS